MSHKPRGIEELLRRWMWRLPEDCDPVKVGYCPTCGENVLMVHSPDGPAKLTRSGDQHTEHPHTHSLPGDRSLDDPARRRGDQ